MSLKRALTTLVVLALASAFLPATASTQTRHHDLSLSYGVVTMDQVADALTDILTILLTFGTYGKQNAEYSGTPFLTYRYASRGESVGADHPPASGFGIGFAIGTYSAKGGLTLMGEPSGTFKENNYVGAVEFDYRWIMRRNFQLYSGAGVGVRIRRGTYAVAPPIGTQALQPPEEKISKVMPTFHLNALGFRFGRQIGFFAELGVGYKGLFNAGLSAQF